MQRTDLIVFLVFVISTLCSLGLFFWTHMVAHFILELEVIGVFSVIYITRCLRDHA